MASHLWTTFLDLCRTRQPGAMGPGPLGRADLRLWEADEGNALDAWERRAILSLDQAWLKSVNTKIT